MRRHLLPLLREQYNPQVDQALCRLAGLAGQAQQVIDLHIEQLWEQAVQRDGQGLAIDLDALRPQPPYLTAELLRRCWKAQQWPQRAMTLDHWEQLAELVRGQGAATHHFPGSVCVRRDAQTLRLSSI